MERPGPYSDLNHLKQDEAGHAEPCHACGAAQDEGVVVRYEYPAVSFSVQCRVCGALGPPGFKSEPSDFWGAVGQAIDNWNKLGAAGRKG